MGTAPPALLGRGHEQRRLRERLDEARAGEPRAVLVSGEAGIGKTSLVRGFVSEATSRGTRVISGRCVDGFAIPYAPLVDSLFPELRARLAWWSRDNPAFEPLLAFLRAWPGVVADHTDADGLHLRYLLGEALIRLALEEDVVIAIDDFHWSDQPTADLVVQTVFRASDRKGREPVRLLVLATFRDEELGRVRSHVARLLRESICSTMELRGLDRVETGELIDRVGVAHLSPDDLTRVHHLSRGNPLYVEALARSLERDEVSGRRSELPDQSLPYEIRDVVDSVVALLDTPSQDVLRTAAVFGDSFSPTQLQDVLDVPGTELDAALDAASDAGLLVWRHDNLFEFAHPLYREALRRTLAPRRERATHVRIARSLAQSPREEPVSVIASHYVGAGSDAEASAAIPVLVAAARQAEMFFAWDEAVRFLEAAIVMRQNEPADATTVELEHRLGIAKMYSGDSSGGLGHLRLARRVAEDLGLAVEGVRVTVDELHCEAIALRTGLDLDTEGLERRFSELESSHADLACRGLAELAQYRWVALDFEGGEALAGRALECARLHGVHDAAESALRSLAMIDWRFLHVERSYRRLVEARDHGRAARDRKVEVGSACRLPIAMIWSGDLTAARTAVDDALHVVRETNYLTEETYVRLALAYLDVVDGSIDAALERLAGIFLLERITGYTWTSVLARALVARSNAVLGQWEVARAAIDDWDSTSRALSRASSSTILRGLVLAGEGRREEAIPLVQWDADVLGESQRSMGDDSAAATLIEAVDLGDLRQPVDGALTFLRSLDDTQLFTTTFMQLIPRVIGDALLLQGHMDESEEQLRSAAAVAAKLGSGPELAMCWFSLARVRVAVGDPTEAEQFLREAARLSRIHRLYLAQRVDTFARHTGLSLGSDAFSDEGAEGSDEVVVMFVDIVDSTRLTWEYGDERFRGIAARLDRNIRQAIDRCGGNPIEGITLGDGLLATLTSPARALECAVDCIDAASSLGLAVHVGLNLGSVVRDRSNVFGTTVNVAARVTAQAQPNEILVTESVMQRSGRPLRYFADRGLSELKGVPRPVRLYTYVPSSSDADG